MNIQEWRKLGEALERFDGNHGKHRGEMYGCIDCYHNKPCPDRAILDAARLTYDRYQECGECEGDGEFGWDDSDASHPDRYGTEPCSSCGGSGLKPNQAEAQIDKLAQFIMDEIPGEPSQSESAVDTAIRLLAVRAFDKETE